MSSSSPTRAENGLAGKITWGRLGFALALIVLGFGATTLQASIARAAGPTAPAKAPLISGMPLLLTTDTSAQFTFGPGTGETQEVTGFVCRVDSDAFQACTSPLSLSGLAVGDHFIGIKATNSIGTGPEATFAWSVDPAPTETPVLGALKANPKTKKVKPGKQVTITVEIENSGLFEAKGTKVCVTAPDSLVAVKKCERIGLLDSEETGTAEFNVTIKKSARKGKKAVLNFTATATGAESKTAKSTITVK